jgi:hypothetical protein
MEFIRGGMKAPIATDWVSVADIGGGDGSTTGETIVSSAVIAINQPKVTASSWVIETQFDHIRTAGSGNNQAWVQYEGNAQDVLSTSGTIAISRYSPVFIAINFSRSRIVLWKPPLFPFSSFTNNEQLRLFVLGKGTVADNVWTITNIRSRLLYVPL